MKNQTKAKAKPAKVSAKAATRPPSKKAVRRNGVAESKQGLDQARDESAQDRILVIDIGGTKVKVLASGETEVRKTESGPTFSPSKLVETSKELAKGWKYDAISLGYPGRVGTPAPLGGGQSRARLGRFRFRGRLSNARPRPERRGHAKPSAVTRGAACCSSVSGRASDRRSFRRTRSCRWNWAACALADANDSARCWGVKELERIGKKAWATAVAAIVHEFLAAFEVEMSCWAAGMQGSQGPASRSPPGSRPDRLFPRLSPSGIWRTCGPCPPAKFPIVPDRPPQPTGESFSRSDSRRLAPSGKAQTVFPWRADDR